MDADTQSNHNNTGHNKSGIDNYFLTAWNSRMFIHSNIIIFSFVTLYTFTISILLLFEWHDLMCTYQKYIILEYGK